MPMRRRALRKGRHCSRRDEAEARGGDAKTLEHSVLHCSAPAQRRSGRVCKRQAKARYVNGGMSLACVSAREGSDMTSPKAPPTLEEFRARAALTGLPLDGRGHRASAQGLCRIAAFDGSASPPIGPGPPSRRMSSAPTSRPATAELTTLGIAEAGRLLARGEITSTALTEAFLEAHRSRRSQDRELHHRHRRAARASPPEQADMEMKGRASPRPPARHPDRAQGHLRDRRRQDDRPFASQDGLRAGDRRRDGAAPEGRAARSSWASSARTSSPTAR